MIYIDVSHYDWDRNGANLNWALIKSSGIDVVIIRASYGDPSVYAPVTRYFKEMATAAKAAGLKVGGYHNLISGDLNSIKRQVTYFRSQLDLVGADYAMVDIEPYDALQKNGLWPRISDAELFAQEFTLVDSRKLMVYLPKWVWTGWLNMPDLRPLMDKARGPLVNSNYPSAVGVSSFDQLYVSVGGDNGPGWSSYGNVIPEGWQYSSNSIVPGASSATDVNAFKGTVEEFENRMAWVVTRNMTAFRDQMNQYFPNRDKTSDGTIGDYAHTQEKSGHNPDDTSQHNAEWDGDSDTKQEVRAIDIDNNTGDPDVSMEDILQHLLALAKKDKNFPVRYMIYNKRIFNASNGWVQETYTGSSPHTEHIHLSGARSDSADENYYNYRLDELMALTADDKTFIANTVNAVWKSGTQSDGTLTTPAGNLVLTQGIPNGLSGGTKAPAWKVIQDLGTALTALLSKVDLDPNEVAEIKDALAIPTAKENADAVVAALSSADVNSIAEVLQNGLPADKLAELKAAL
jgi:GH25 family lysozyme M1 (1,4-beta-N-acetylmuramidase)